MKTVKRAKQYPHTRKRKEQRYRSNEGNDRSKHLYHRAFGIFSNSKPTYASGSFTEKCGILYHQFAKLCSDIIGHAITFILALAVIIVWLISGPFFHYSDTWQLFINTGTTVITFLIVFLIQNTLNRENETIQIKLDELIKAHKKAKNAIINLENLSDSQIRKLEKRYNKLGRKN